MRFFSSLAHRNFRLYFFGQAMSLVGVWMQGTAVSWLVWRLTESPKWLGMVGFAAQIPILIFGLFAGVVIDRFSRWKLIVIIQVLAMIQALLLAAFTLTGMINAPLIFALSLFLGTIFAFDYPSRQAFLMDMAGKCDIQNAIALNSSIVHASRVAGPAIAGFIISRYNEGACFAINALSFIFVLTSLLMMNRDELCPQTIEIGNSMFNSIKEALKYVWRTENIRRPLILVGVLSLSAMQYVVLLPQLVSERFSGGSRELGLAMSSAGLGALFGAAYFAYRRKTDGLYNIVKHSLSSAGIMLIIISVIPTFNVAVPFFILLGLSTFLVVAGSHTIVQTEVESSLRGRVMSIFTISFFGLSPIGSMVAGLASAKLGVAFVIAVGGLICLLMPKK